MRVSQRRHRRALLLHYCFILPLSLSVTDRSMIPRRSRRLARDADEEDAIPVSLPSGSWSRSIVVNETGWLHIAPIHPVHARCCRKRLYNKRGPLCTEQKKQRTRRRPADRTHPRARSPRRTPNLPPSPSISHGGRSTRRASPRVVAARRTEVRPFERPWPIWSLRSFA